MAQHPDVRIVRLGFRRSQENEVRLETSSQMRLPDQLSAYSATLKSHVNGQVRQIRAVAEVRNRPGNTHQQSIGISSGCDDVRVSEHSGHRPGIIYRAPFRQRGTPQDVDKLLDREIRLQRIFNVNHSSNLPIFESTTLFDVGWGHGDFSDNVEVYFLPRIVVRFSLFIRLTTGTSQAPGGR